MAIHSLGYVRLTSPDVDAWRVFAGEFLGMAPTGGLDDSAAYFRVDEHPARLVVAPGAESSATVGFEVRDRRRLAELVAAVEAAGIEVTTPADEVREERRVSGLVQFDDPAGNRVELYYGPVLDHEPVRTPTVSRFVTGDLGFGHVIVSTPDIEASYDFYTGVLGFVERNTMAGGRVVFLGCNPRHHTLGLTKRPGPGSFMHLMVEVATLDDVGLALDRAHRLAIPMMHTLGKHTNDQMVSFYVYSPEDHAIEFGWNGLLVADDAPTYEISAGAYWGHRFTPPPVREASS